MTYILGGDDESFLEEFEPDQEKFLLIFRDPELVTCDTGQLKKLKDSRVEQGIADGEGELNVAQMT